MKFSLASLAVVALATQTVTADWFGQNSASRLVYNKWHETELERWLSDHNIPYPTASDRKGLQNLVQKNWDNNVAKPYSSWDTNQLSSYLSSKGQQAKKGTEKNKDSLVEQVASYWHSTADQANEAASDVKSYIFDSWTESQLKSFLDYHGIPNPSPRTRDSLLHTARSNYQSAATKAGQTFAYPGDWIYSQWSDSDMKAWLDERGIPVPQPGNRDKLIASMRRNAYQASKSSSSILSSASKSAAAAQATLSDQLLASWSDSKLKEWLDKAGVPVPQGSKKNELVALARKHSNQLSGGAASSVSASGASAYGAATSSAGNYYAQATNNAYGGLRYYVDYALNQVGIGSKEAKASLSSVAASVSSAASVATASVSSAASVASSSASSLASVASKSAASASSSASKAGGNPISAASSAAREVSSSASSAASVASSSLSVSAKSASSVASKSSSSASSVASVSAKSAASVASSSSKSAASVASASAKSASAKASSSASSLSAKASSSSSSLSNKASSSSSSYKSSSLSSSISSASSSLSSASSSAKKEL